MPRSNPLQTRSALLNAQRVARHRERRKRGEICLSHIVLDPWEVSGLIAGGWLARNQRGNAKAVFTAFADFVAASLDQRRYRRPGR
jgi:hypothetical protein